jgi:hypothetical protein
MAVLLCVSGFSFADESSWKEEYGSICGKSHDAVLLSTEDLMTRIDRCKALLNVIRETDNPNRKIYTFRLEKCSNFYQYLLDKKMMKEVK